MWLNGLSKSTSEGETGGFDLVFISVTGPRERGNGFSEDQTSQLRTANSTANIVLL